VVTSSSQERKQGPYTPLSAAAQGLRDRGVSIYVIGIGDKVKVAELMDLSSDYRNVFVADDFSTVRSRGKVVTEIIKNGTEDSSRGKLKLIGLRVAFCLCGKISPPAKPFVWKCVPPTGSFSRKSNSFSYETFCTKTRFETGNR